MRTLVAAMSGGNGDPRWSCFCSGYGLVFQVLWTMTV